MAAVRAADAAGVELSRHDYLPFGEEWAAGAATQPARFTGKERDAESGLDYFGARYYRAYVGRFATVDPVQTVAESLTDPQRWNGYAYARNTPIRWVDPDGRCIKKSDATKDTATSDVCNPTADLKPDAGGVQFIKDHEKLELTVYPDTALNPTVG